MQASTAEQLLVELLDAGGQQVQNYAIALKNSATQDIRVSYRDQKWRVEILAPTNRLGFFQAKARLSNGVSLPRISTRPAGYLTYAIVPDPQERKSYPARETFFGMMGASEAGIMGGSWNTLNYTVFSWNAFEPERAGQFEETIKEREKVEAKGGWSGIPSFEGKQLTIPTSLPHNKPPTEYRRMGQSTHVPVVQSGEQ